MSHIKWIASNREEYIDRWEEELYTFRGLISSMDNQAQVNRLDEAVEIIRELIEETATSVFK